MAVFVESIGQSYKVYPGGVIALRAIDWMGGARGTLTSETDIRAISGKAVRDTQQTSTSLWANNIGAYQSASNTLELDLSKIPVEIGMPYLLKCSILIEGDLDPTNLDSRRGASNREHSFACGFGWHGDSTYHLTDANPAFLLTLPRLREHYTLHTVATVGDVAGTEIIKVRAYSYTASTTQWLIDQIFLVPYVFSGTHAGQWRPSDFARAGQANSDTITSPGVVNDGADGGDNYGKFTWWDSEDETRSEETDDGGDYQHKTSYNNAEYTMLYPWDYAFSSLENSQTNQPAKAHGYSVVGVNYRSSQYFLNDSFSRTVAANDWGASPEGLGYALNTTASGNCSVDGAEGIINTNAVNPTVAPVVSLHRSPGVSGLNAGTIGTNLILDSFSWSGRLRIATPVYSGSGTQVNVVDIGMGSLGADRCWTLSFDALAKTWRLALGNSKIRSAYFGTEGSSTYLMHGDVDISSWFSYGGSIGFRIERKRYLFRVRVWDASGAEPSTWNFEGFLPITSNTSGNLTGAIKTYPYSDNFTWAHNLLTKEVFLWLSQTWSNTNTGWKSYWDNFQIQYNPEGNPFPIYSSMESPIGNKLDEIQVSYGAYQMICWGLQTWTITDGSNNGWLEFAARNWSNTAAAKLQKAESTGYYFRSIHTGPINLSRVRFRAFQGGDVPDT